jgi:nitrous oxidase accessory protein NosD
MKLARLTILCGLVIAAVGVTPTFAAEPAEPGLLRPVATPTPVSGTTHSITDFGATPDDPADDDATAVQAAIDASAAGDEVLVPNGVFHLKTRKITLKSGVSVRGESRAGAVLHAAFTPQDDGKNAYVLYAAPGTSDLTISSVHITSDGDTSVDTALNQAIWLGDGDSECQECNLDIPAVHTIRVTDVEVTKFVKMALNIRNGHDITMDGNLVHDALADGGGGQGYGIMLGYDQTANNAIHHNRIERGAGKMRHGILLQYRANHNLVEHNTVRDLSEDAIDLHGEDEYANEIRHNVVTGSARAGFGVGNTGGDTEHGASGPDNWIHHNEVSGSLMGLRLIRGSDSTRIEFNDFHDNTETGIQVNDGGGDDLTIRCNTLTGNGTGLRLEESANSLVECNDTSESAEQSLVLSDTVTGYTVRHNDFRGALVNLESDQGEYAGNCDDDNGATDCLATCPSGAGRETPQGKETQ